MHVWLHWFQGPLFWAAVTFLVLGLGRRLALAAAALRAAQRRAGDKQIVYRAVWRATVRWLSPRAPLRARPWFGVTSVVFHVSIIAVPLLLAGHIALIRDAIGWSWPALPNAVATALAVTAVVAAVALVAERVAARPTRALSGLQEYALPVLVAVPFLSGLAVMHPAWNPLSYDVMLLLHTASADLLLVLIPITKLSHIALFPVTQLVTEVAWHFAPDGGERVGIALGRGGEPI